MELDYKTLYNHAPCGYLFTMEDGTLIDVNDTFLAFTGYSREEIIKNKRYTVLYHGYSGSLCQRCIAEYEV